MADCGLRIARLRQRQSTDEAALVPLPPHTDLIRKERCRAARYEGRQAG